MGRLNGQHGCRIIPGLRFLDVSDQFSATMVNFAIKLHISDSEKYLQALKTTELEYGTKILAYVPNYKNIKLTKRQIASITDYYLNQAMLTKSGFNYIISKINGAMTLFEFLKFVSKDEMIRQKVAGDLLLKIEKYKK